MSADVTVSISPGLYSLSDHLEFTKSKQLNPKMVQKSPSSQDSIEGENKIEIENFLNYVPEVQSYFTILRKIGEGTFSCVYLARLLNESQANNMFALKHIIPTSHPSRIESELRCLQQIGGIDNVMGVRACLRHKDHIVIVMPYFAHEKFSDYVTKMTLNEVKEYMKNLFHSLQRVHSFDIIHRDIKPSNFLYNRATKKCALVDFGLAQKIPGTDENSSTTLIRNLPGSLKHSNVLAKSKVTLSDCENIDAIVSRKKDVSLVKKFPHGDVLKPLFQTQTNILSVSPKMSKLILKKTHPSPRRTLLAKRAMMASKDRVLKKAVTTVTKQFRNLATDKAVIRGTCACYGAAFVCKICLSRSGQVAPRAGTPGFRAPEVLLKYPDQTTAVDIWSAGVILLSLLSGRYPFFRAQDDLTALAQIIAIMGSKPVQEAAAAFGKNVICKPECAPVDLSQLCRVLRQGNYQEPSQDNLGSLQQDNKSEDLIPFSAYDLLYRLLDLNPLTRITAAEALQHPFISRGTSW